jgi:NAD-dependent SIR2 family protein deacetylase
MDKIKQLFNDADGVMILAGAGMGVDAGIPDFRGSSGIWTSEKDTFIKFASGPAWRERPLEAWNFYINRIIKYSQVQPHRGYIDLKNLGKDVYVVTSNVDGHFKAAGYDHDKIYEIHGNLEHIQCSRRCSRDIQPMPAFTGELTRLEEAPHCPRCGSVMRPVVMMFSDPAFEDKIVTEQSDKFWAWRMSKKNVIGIELGAGTYVPSIRSMSRDYTNSTIRINPHDFQVTRPEDISIQATAIEGIDTLFKLLGK